MIDLGKVVGTHGIKGEVRLRSKFPYKKKAFRLGNTIFLGDDAFEITSYRVHKDYDMLTFKGYTNINQVLPFVGRKASISKEELSLGEEEYLEEELFDYQVVTNRGEGKLLEIVNASASNQLLRIELNGKSILVPFQEAFVKVNPQKKEISITLIEGM